jgi:hypothetical protein
MGLPGKYDPNRIAEEQFPAGRATIIIAQIFLYNFTERKGADSNEANGRNEALSDRVPFPP